MKNVARFLVSQGLLAGFLVLLACSNLHGDTVVRTLSPEGPDTTGGAFLLAPGYCPSYGGSHLYEYISSVDVVQIGEIMTITVYVWIANPTGCTAGSPCPEYDASPEYINVWIDWDGDKVWENNERVMNEALTGYLGINYAGTMTATRQFTIPPGAVPTTWLRANLGWGHDPNDPCQYSWTWGDVLDKEVQLANVRLLRIETLDNVEMLGVPNVIWERSFDDETCNLQDIDVSSNWPIAAPFTKGAFGLKVTVGYCPSKPSWDPMIICQWSIPEANIKEKTTTWGWEKRFNVLLPQKVGKYTLDLKLSVFDNHNGLLDYVSLPSTTLYVTYDDPLLGETLRQLWVEKATSWANGATGDFDICHKLMDHIYGPAPWTYKPSLGFYDGVWKELLEGTRNDGHCMFFAETWAKVGQILGLASVYTWYNDEDFITKTSAKALDNTTGNIYKSNTNEQDRWKFIMHSFGAYPAGTNTYFDPTFGKTYTDEEEYIEWYYSNNIIVWAPMRKKVGEKYVKPKPGTPTEYVNLYTKNYDSFLAGHYYGPYPSSSPTIPAPPPILFASASGNYSTYPGKAPAASAIFTGAYYVEPVDSDGDGRYNQLSVGIEVNVSSFEKHLLEGELMIGDTVITNRGKMGVIVPSVYEVDTIPGLDTVVVSFCGEDIYRKGYDGEYTFYFSLSDTSHNLIDVFEFSATLNHAQFGEIPARITGIADRGVDVDEDGLYDHLEIEVALSVDIAANYSLMANLTAGDREIDKRTTINHLNAGDVSVKVLFRGNKINLSKENGPYKVTLSLEDKVYGVIDYRSFFTSTYNHTDFKKNKATLLNHHQESPIDTNGNGLYDILRVQSDIQIDSTGLYFIRAWLEDSLQESIDLLEVSLTSGPGIQSANLDFAGVKVYEHQVNGPYILRYVTIHDEDGKLIDAVTPGYLTAAYSYLAFERPVPPLIALTGNFEDLAEDTDGDGLFEYLTVGVEVTCRDAGYAVGNARLVGPNGEEILWATDNVHVEAGVPKMLPLIFDGRYIYGNLQDGPYFLSHLLVYHTGDPDQSVYMPEPYITNAYEYTAFERSAVIAGTVSDKGTPVLGALLSVQGVDYDYTNSGGDYSLTVLQGGHYTVTIEDPGGYEIDSWLIYVNGELVGQGHSVQVECTVGAVTDVDFKTSIPADVDIDPNILNLGSWGRCVTCYIELPSEYDVCEIDVSTVSFNNQVNAMLKPIEIGDYDNDGIPDLMVKFHRPSVQEILVVGDSVVVTVNGKVGTAAFEGMDTIRVIDPSPSVKGNESPGAFSLCQNYPNPFNPETKISYVLPNVCHVNISIYNLLGQRVATIVNECQTAGHRTLHWDAKDENGEQVASGVFFYRIQAGDFVQSKKMVLMK